MREKLLPYIHRQKKKILIVAAAIVLVAAVIVAFLLFDPAYAPNPPLVSFVNDRIAKQKSIEADIQAAFQAGKYTFDQPLVIQDPYQTSPLTALVIFDTPEDSQISIHVPGKTPEASVDFTFPGFQKHHEIPVYGLYADTLNHVTLGKADRKGQLAQTTLDLQTEPLPVFIQNFKIDKVDRNKYSPGFNFTFLDNKLIFDIDGAVRWYSTEATQKIFTKLSNGRYLYIYGSNLDTLKLGWKLEEEADLLGKVFSVYIITDGIHHDIFELPNGNLLVTSSDLKSDTIEDFIYEVDRKSGHIVRRIDLKQILDVNRPPEIGKPSNDWFHLNSIVYDPTDRSIIISSKAQSAVVKLSYPGMQIKWILGPHDNWSAKYQPYLLTPLGDNFEWQWSQHDATIYGTRSPADDSIDILLFNNGIFRSFDLASATPGADLYSNLIHYRINEKAMTVEEVWQYGRENGAATFSSVYGSASLLPNGNILGCWGYIKYKLTKIIEVDPSSNKVVFQATEPIQTTYRTFRAGFYDGYAERTAYLSTPINNTISSDLVDRAGMAWSDLQRWSTPQRANLVLDVKRVLNATRLFHFQTGLVPQPFDKVGPKLSVTNQTAKLKLSWKESIGAASYEYCLSTTTPCTNWTDVGKSTSQLLSGLKPETTYYWNVRALNSTGTSPSNRNPTDWSFTTANKPAPFTKSSPSAFASNVSASPTLAWGTSPGATAYGVCFNTTPTCKAWVATGTATSKELTGLEPNTTYYWTAKASNGFGTIIANGSTWWSFTTTP